MTNVCFHHNDLDGRCAAAIVRRALGKDNVELREVAYGADCTQVDEGTKVYFVDYAPTAQDFEKLVENKCEITILDHHVRPDLEGRSFEGVISPEASGCQHAWNYFFKDEPMPIIVNQIGRYDIWDHSDPRTLPLYYGLMLMEQDPTNDEMWDNLFNPISDEKTKDWSVLDQLMNMGSIALTYRGSQDDYIMKNAHEIKLGDLKIAVVNAILPDSYSFIPYIDKATEDVDAVMWYYRMPKGQWKYSIRTEKEGIDVREIAAQHGGGGHKGSAGFVTDELLPELKA